MVGVTVVEGVIEGVGRIAPTCREYVVWSQLQS